VNKNVGFREAHPTFLYF